MAAAVVQATSAEQQLNGSAVANRTGFYNLLAMPSGAYAISITAPGFEELVQNDVRLRLGENLPLDGTLTVGSLSSEVTVSSTATLAPRGNFACVDIAQRPGVCFPLPANLVMTDRNLVVP